jgi:hypothetical protein
MPGQPKPPNRSYFESDVQSFDTETRAHLFSVRFSLTNHPPPNAWSMYLSKIRSRPRPEETISVPDNYRVIDHFLQKEGWLAHVEGFNPIDLKALTMLARDEPFLPNLVGHCEAYLHHHQATLTSYYVRRLISTRPK